MQDVSAPESLRQFQIVYGRYLRNPNKTALPESIPPRRSEIYESLLFNNICGFINNCFPVSRSLFEPAKWNRISRSFFEEWRCTTPIFSQIPYEFVRYISERPIGETLVPWLSELLHYEWVELEVDLDEAVFDKAALESKGLNINPTAKLLAYQWPVHKIASDYQPDEMQQVCLVVYRDVDAKVRFTEVNATTLMLLQAIADWQAPLNALNDLESLLLSFGESINHPEPTALTKFGVQLLTDLKAKEILIGDVI